MASNESIPPQYTSGVRRRNRGQFALAFEPSTRLFPSTRYQGSKLKLLEWIWSSIAHIDFDSALDLFSGTSSVGYLFKVKGKTVTSNDYLRFNKTVADALICNSGTRLAEPDALSLISGTEGGVSPGFIEREYSGVFYLDSENRWLDCVVSRLHLMPEGHQKSLAFFALYQACLAKRPYNLFHRANLYMRTADVERSFGNKVTWEKSFSAHFMDALHEANEAVFSNGRDHRATCGDFLGVDGAFDLVYMDPPYLNSRGVGVDYLEFYHFLEGMTEYPEWESKIAAKYKHKPYVRVVTPWSRKETIVKAFDAALERYRDSVIVISYRSDGIPSIDDLVSLLDRHGRRNAVESNVGYKYVLSHGASKEVLLVSERG